MKTEKLSDRAFGILEKMIVLGEIAPGSLVSEKHMMNVTGFGRTPVREAIQRLARERMVEIHPQKGILVPSNSVEVQLELLEIRRELDPLAAKLSATRATERQREEARQLAASVMTKVLPEIESFAKFLRDAHELTVASTQNEFLKAAMAPLQGRSRRFWFSHLTRPDEEMSKAASLHRRILLAIADHDEAQAVETSNALVDYLVAFAFATLPTRSPYYNPS